MKESGRKGLYRIHAWLGLNLGLLLFLVCFTGTVAVFSPEINWLLDSGVRVEAPADATSRAISWQKLHDGVRRAYPHAIPLRLSAPNGETWAAHAAVLNPPGNLRTVLIDPYTGEAQGQRSSFNIVSFFRIYHKQFYIVPVSLGIHGIVIVGVLGLMLLVSVLSGIWAYRRWWRSFFRLRTDRSGRVFWSDLHRLAGVWALAVSIVFGVTGTWYLVEYVLAARGLPHDAGPAPRLEAGDFRALPSSVKVLDLDRAAALAREAFPGLEISSVALPVRAGAPLIFTGQAAAWVVRPRANQVYMNPYTGKILDIRRGEELPPLARWREMADPLHFGTFGGLATRLIWFAAGAMLCAGILTGFYGFWLRTARHTATGRPSRVMALCAVAPSLAVIGASAFGAWVYGVNQQRMSQAPSEISAQHGVGIGPWTVSVARLDTAATRPGHAAVLIGFDGDAQPNFRRAEAWIGGKEEAERAAPLRRLSDRLIGNVAFDAAACNEGCALTVRIHDWQGESHVATVPFIENGRPAGDRATALAPVPDLPPGVIAVILVFVVLSLLPVGGWTWMQLRSQASAVKRVRRRRTASRR